MYVFSNTTKIREDFHIYERAHFENHFSYIQKILLNLKSLRQNTKVDYIYNLYNLLLLYYITISFFYFLLLQFKSKKEMIQ